LTTPSTTTDPAQCSTVYNAYILTTIPEYSRINIFRPTSLDVFPWKGKTSGNLFQQHFKRKQHIKYNFLASTFQYSIQTYSWMHLTEGHVRIQCNALHPDIPKHIHSESIRIITKTSTHSFFNHGNHKSF
jgi:hypothetical protein